MTEVYQLAGSQGLGSYSGYPSILSIYLGFAARSDLRPHHYTSIRGGRLQILHISGILENLFDVILP
jgi:hypothetical protein